MAAFNLASKMAAKLSFQSFLSSLLWSKWSLCIRHFNVIFQLYSRLLAIFNLRIR